MNKIIKYIFINVLILLICLGVFEYILVSNYLKENPTEKYHIGIIPYEHLFSGYKFRNPSGINYNKAPIMIFGCSFAFGERLNENDTINEKLSLYSKRPVYNYSIKGKSLQNALYTIQKGHYDTTLNNPEYAIYIMMSDHVRRIYSNVCMGDYVGQPIYEFDKNGVLKQKTNHYPVYRQFYTFYYINNLIYNKFLKNDYERHNKYVYEYFRQMRDSLRDVYPDIKFVILLYGDDYSDYGLDFSKLEKEGFIVINTNNLTGVNLLQSKYQLSDNDTHPTAQAWDIISRALVKELKL